MSETDREPIAANQLRLWIHQEFDLGSNAYNITRSLRLRGPLDAPALIGAVNALVERHEMLRTTFAEEGDTVRLRIADPAPVLAGVTEVPGTGPGDRAELPPDVEDACRAFALAPFDLRAEPPFRARLLRLGDRDHLLLLAFHHIGVDGHSLGVLEHELAEAYAALAAAGVWHPATAPAPFSAFARHQRSVLTEETAQHQLRHWREALPAELPPVSFLATSPLGGGGAGPVAVHSATVPREAADALAALGAAHQLTAFGVFQTAVQILAHRYSGSPDAVLATTTLNRKEPRFEGSVGFFVNTVALHTPLGDNPTLAEALERGGRTLIGALSHDDLPFDRVVRELSPRPPGERGALFQIAVETQSEPAGRPRGWGELSVEAGGFDGHPAKRARGDLTLNLLRGAGGGLRLVTEYDSALFDERFIDGLARSLFTLLAEGARAPGTPVSDLPLLDRAAEAELRTLRSAPPRGDTSVPMSDLVRSLAVREGDRTALTAPGERVGFAGLTARAEAVAEALIGRGIAPGAFIGVVADRSVHSVVALLGVWLARCAYVPLDPRTGPEHRDHLLDDAGVRQVLGPPGFDARGAELIDVRALPATPAQRDAPESRTTAPDDIAYAIYTSGTTGKPKATLATHANLLHLRAGLGAAFQVPDWRRETVSLNGPLVFDVTLQQLLPLLDGATVAIVPEETRLDPDAMIQYVADAGITLLDVTPGHLRLLVEAGLLDRTDLPLRTLITGGEALPAPLWAPLAAGPLRVFNCYGPTECTVNSTVQAVDATAGRPSIGTEVAGVSLFVADSRRRLVPYGATGELYIAGGGLGPGYLGRPALTAERFVHAPWGPDGAPLRVYRTGDRVRLARGGVVEHLGRLDDQVKIRGNRVEPGEVTAALLTHPRVAAAVTLADDSDGRGAVLHSFVVAAGEGAGQEELRRHLGACLPAYMVPTRIIPVPALPANAAGKTDRTALRALLAAPIAPDPGTEPTAATTAPDGTEHRLTALWREVLGRPELGPDAHFFASGGHSLLAARLIARLRREFGAGLTLAALLEGPTPREFAARVRAAAEPAPGRAGEWRHLIELSAAPDDEPVVCLHPLGGDALVYQDLVDALPVPRQVYGVFDGRTDPRTLGGWASPEEMIRAYAAEITGALDGRPCHITGWSLGGLIAHGVAQRLEETGARVRSLTIWDAGCSPVRFARPAEPDWSAGPLTVLATLAPEGVPTAPAEARDRFGARFATLPGPDLGERILRAADSLWGTEARGEPRAVGDRAVLASLHNWLFTGWRPGTVRAPVSVVWAADSLARGVVAKTDWSRYTRATARASQVDGTHYSIMKRPVAGQLAEALLRFADSCSPSR
ncbi:non-ribosomal peptide synthetase [Streptomyces sp. NPDC001889]